MSGTKTLGEKVMRRPVVASRRAAAAGISSVRGASSSSRNDEALSMRATLVGGQRRPVSDPQHLTGPDPRAGKVLTGADATNRFALLLALDRHDREHGSARSPET